VPASDLEDRALGVGRPDSTSRDSGKSRARWAKVDLTGGGAVAGTVKEYDVSHDLGEVAQLCVLERYSNPQVAGTFIVAAEARPENWSHSHCHVSLRLVSGSFDGCVADFRVWGR
jgi:hypothetical protein